MAGSGQRTANPPARTRRPQGGQERRRLSRRKQRQAVVLGALKGALMRSYPARGELFETQGGEYACAPAWVSIHQSKFLRVEVERRLLLLDQHSSVEPLVPR